MTGAATILDQNDPETVRDGAPAYLLAIDGLIEGDPENSALLLTGSELYGSYASAFVEDEVRRRRLWDRALGYAQRALCLESSRVCDAVDAPFDEFAASLEAVGLADVPAAYGFGAAWGAFIGGIAVVVSLIYLASQIPTLPIAPSSRS
jgi:hypothetical protein